MFFQGVLGDTPLRSGVLILPLTVTNMASGLLSGLAISVVGWYTPFMIVGSALLIAGTTMLSLLRPSTSHAYIVGAQCLLGFGIGTGIEQPQLAAQVVLSEEDTPLGLAAVGLGMSLGQAIYISVINAVFATELARAIKTTLAGIVSPSELRSVGVSALFTILPAEFLPEAQKLVATALNRAFYPCVAAAVISLFAACVMEWRSVKPAPKEDEEEKSDGNQQSVESSSIHRKVDYCISESDR